MTEQTSTDITHQIHHAKKELNRLKQELRKLRTKREYIGGDDIDADIDALVDAVVSQEQEVEQLREQYKQQESERLAEKAHGYEFTVPDNDPLLGCMMLAAVAQRLQYEFCRSQGPYESLTYRVYGPSRNPQNNDGPGGNGSGVGDHSDPNYELNATDVDKHEQMRERREYIQTLRMSVAQHFEAMKEELPEDAPFVPTLYRESDEQLVQKLEQKSAERYQQQQEERRQAAEQMKEFTRSEVGVVN